jgi:hypothetical protein
MASAFDNMANEFIAALSTKYDIDKQDLKDMWGEINKARTTTTVATPAPMQASAELSKMTKVELVDHCKQRGLKTTGTKADLIERLTGGATVASTATKKATPTKAEKPTTKAKAQTVEKAKIETNGIPQALREMIKPINYRITKNEYGNFSHAETGLVFDRDLKKFIGKQHSSGRVDKLSDEDIETCHRYNFPYVLPSNLSKAEAKVSVAELDEEEIVGEDDEIIDEEELAGDDDVGEDDLGLEGDE